MHGVEIGARDLCGDRTHLAFADRPVVDARYRGDLSAGSAEEHLVGDVELRPVDGADRGRNAGVARDLEHARADDPLEDVVTRGRRDEHAVAHQEEVLRASFRDVAVLCEDDRLVERSFYVSIVTSGVTSGRSAVLVRNGAKRYTANALAQQLGGLPVDTLPTGEQTSADIVVRVGSDFRGLATDLAR